VIVALDTNVILAAFAARGLSAEVFEICLAEHEIVLSEHIISEVVRNLNKKLKCSADAIQNIESFLRNHARLVIPVAVPADACRDRSDLKVLGTALAGDASCIISGDNDLLEMVSFRDVKMLSPRMFWELLRKS
jgi:putative PIN family toxin of toxin-antitoxin system